MLVEDDKSLREIYGVRLLAEGYDITSAGDGEEALAMAVKERPDLILSDVMMPKISGFDMLDILRSTPETKDIKVIMMTALSSDDQRDRGEKLGADRYLVKSQVGIEDVVRTVHELLADTPAASPATYNFGVPEQTAAVPTEESAIPAPLESATPAEEAPAPATTDNAANEVANVETTPAPTLEPLIDPSVTKPAPAPVAAAEPTNTYAMPAMAATESAYSTLPPAEDQVTTPAPEPAVEPVPEPLSTQPEPLAEPAPQPVITEPQPAPAAPTLTPAPIAPTELPQPTAPFATQAPASLGDRVINPITPTTPPADISYMMEKELTEGSTPAAPTPPPTIPQV
jgi:CheY-like chemotaxis protein